MLPGRITVEEFELSQSPREVLRRIESGMSRVRSLLFTPTWGLDRDFVGNAEDDRFQMRVRHRYSNGYTRLLFGTIEPRGSGSRLRLQFRDVRFVVVLMNAISALLVLSTLGYLFSIWRYASGGGEVDWDAVVAGVSGPVVVLATFLIVEIIGRHLGRKDEQRMREHIHSLFGG